MTKISDQLELIDELYTCPNCGKNTVKNLECKYCQSGEEITEEYLMEEIAKKADNLIFSEKLKGNGKKINLGNLELNGTNYKIYFYNYFGRIEKDKAKIELKIGNFKYKLYFDYKISEANTASHGNDEGTGKRIETINYTDIELEKNGKWEKYFFKNKDNRDKIKYFVVNEILHNYNFNPYISENK